MCLVRFSSSWNKLVQLLIGPGTFSAGLQELCHQFIKCWWCRWIAWWFFNDCWQMLRWNCQICGNCSDHGKAFKLAYNMFGGTLNLAQSNPLWHSKCGECTANVYCIVLCWCSWPTAGDLLDPAEICDLLKGIVLIVCCVVMHYIDVSMMYHIIRGQTVIKLYIFFNMLDVCIYIIITIIIIIDNN